LLLDGAGAVAAGFGGFVVGELVGLGDDAKLAASLDGVGVLDVREAERHPLQRFQAIETGKQTTMADLANLPRRAPGREAMMASAAGDRTVEVAR
jgi:hypothetical protein